MGKPHFPSNHHIVPPDYSTDAIIYVLVVVVFYAAIIILLLTTNFRGKRSSSQKSQEQTFIDPVRKHWLFFNTASGEAQQATRKESQYFIHQLQENMETV